MRSKSCYSFDLCPGVELGIPRVAVIIFLLFPLTEVDPAGQFTDYRKVDTATDVFFKGEIFTRDSEAKLQGRRLPNVESSLRSLRRPCSGRTGPVPYFCLKK